MMKAFSDSIKEDGGQTSSMRFAMYGTTAVVLATYVAHNVMAMVKGEGMVDFALNSVIVLAIAMGSKVTQKFAEKGNKKTNGV